MNVAAGQPGPGGPPPVRVKRLELGLTMKNLAATCAANGAKVSASEISRIERGIHAPRPALRKVLAGVLGLKVTDFDAEDRDGDTA